MKDHGIDHHSEPRSKIADPRKFEITFEDISGAILRKIPRSSNSAVLEFAKKVAFYSLPLSYDACNQNCEMSNLLHGASLPNQILPQEKRVNIDTLRHRWNKINTIGYFWGTKAVYSII